MEYVVTTQAEWDALPKTFSTYTRIIIRDTKGRVAVVARENSSVEAWENSSVEAWGNSSVVAWGNSSVVARENSSVEAWGNSSVVAWGNSSVEAWGNSSVEAWGNSSVVARGNSSVVARGNVCVRIFSRFAKVVIFGFCVAFHTSDLKVNLEVKSVSARVQVVTPLEWFEANGVEKTPTLTLYKRVSADWKTQERTVNETAWPVGTTLTHPKWNPTNEECGPGKFHACSTPYFCDQFRSINGDHYIAISVALEDTHTWENPEYPHKIAFRKGTVMYECNRFGKQIGEAFVPTADKPKRAKKAKVQA